MQPSTIALVPFLSGEETITRLPPGRRLEPEPFLPPPSQRGPISLCRALAVRARVPGPAPNEQTDLSSPSLFLSSICTFDCPLLISRSLRCAEVEWGGRGGGKARRGEATTLSMPHKHTSLCLRGIRHGGLGGAVPAWPSIPISGVRRMERATLAAQCDAMRCKGVAR